MKKQCLAIISLAASLVLAASPATEAAAKAVEEQKCANLVINGNFAKISAKGMATNWSFWKSSKSKAVLTFEKNAGIDGGTAAVLQGGGGSFYTFIKTQPGEKIYARVKVKKTGAGKAGLTLRFMAAKGKWLSYTVNQPITFAKDGEWTTAEIIATAPKDAVQVLPMLGGLDKPEGKIYYTNAELFKVPAAAPAK